MDDVGTIVVPEVEMVQMVPDDDEQIDDEWEANTEGQAELENLAVSAPQIALQVRLHTLVLACSPLGSSPRHRAIVAQVRVCIALACILLTLCVMVWLSWMKHGATIMRQKGNAEVRRSGARTPLRLRAPTTPR